MHSILFNSIILLLLVWCLSCLSPWRGWKIFWNTFSSLNREKSPINIKLKFSRWKRKKFRVDLSSEHFTNLPDFGHRAWVVLRLVRLLPDQEVTCSNPKTSLLNNSLEFEFVSHILFYIRVNLAEKSSSRAKTLYNVILLVKMLNEAFYNIRIEMFLLEYRGRLLNDGVLRWIRKKFYIL